MHKWSTLMYLQRCKLEFFFFGTKTIQTDGCAAGRCASCADAGTAAYSTATRRIVAYGFAQWFGRWTTPRCKQIEQMPF